LLGDAKVHVDLPTCAKTIPILVVEVEHRRCQRLSTFFLIDITVPLALIWQVETSKIFYILEVFAADSDFSKYFTFMCLLDGE
jgi:hypothetical protein